MVMTVYELEPTTVDISNKQSVENFLQTLEESLVGSPIKASMDLDGNITFKRLDGGRIILQEFTSATGGKVLGHQVQDKEKQSL